MLNNPESTPLLIAGFYDTEFTARIGVLPQEKIIPQTYVASLEVSYSPAALLCHTDSIEAAVSYVDLYEIAKKEFETGANLLETIAIKTAEAVKSQFPYIKSGNIHIFKLNPPVAGMVGKTGIKYFF